MGNVSEVTGEVVAGLKQQPAMLAVVLLNLVMVGAMGWFLMRVADASNAEKLRVYELLNRCYPPKEKA